MTTSGTTNVNFDLADIVEEAFERAGRRLRGGYDYRSARRSLDLITIDWASRGLNLWLVDQQNFAVTANQVTQTLPADTVDVIEVVYRTNPGSINNQVDLPLNRLSVSDYAQIANKLVSGQQPYQYYIDRQTAAPVMYLYPTPNGTQAGTINYWRLRRIQDTGAPASNTMDMPFRFLPALVAGLAYHLALKFEPNGGPNPFIAMPRLNMLKQAYDEAWQTAADEDRDRASVRLVPFVDYGTYT